MEIHAPIRRPKQNFARKEGFHKKVELPIRAILSPDVQSAGLRRNPVVQNPEGDRMKRDIRERTISLIKEHLDRINVEFH